MNLPIKSVEVGSHKDFRNLLPKYFTEEVSGLSPLTIDAKKRDLKMFMAVFQSLCGGLDSSLWDPFVTKYFIDHLIKEEYAPASVNRALATIRALGHWLHDQGVLKNSPTKGIRELRLAEPASKSISDINIARLKKSSDSLLNAPRSKCPQNFRNKVILLSLESSALRVSELLGLRCDQFSHEQKKFVNVYCKGGRVRDVRIRTEVADLVKEYISSFRTSGSNILFTNRYGGRLSRNGLAKSFRMITGHANAFIVESEKIENLKPHTLRHRAGYRARQLKDVAWAAKKLGHASLRHVERYATLNEDEEKKLTESI